MASVRTTIQLSGAQRPFAKACQQRNADYCWEYALYASKHYVPRRSCVVWRWVTCGTLCWKEFALKPRLAMYTERVSHFVLEWVNGHWRGQVPWWQAEGCKETHGTVPFPRAWNRAETRIWQLPTVAHRQVPDLVSHKALWADNSGNSEKGVVWVVGDDFTLRGERPATLADGSDGVPGRAMVFDMLMCDAVVKDWNLPELQAVLDAQPRPPHATHVVKPKALYHGTGGRLRDLAWIKKGQALQPSQTGMNGPGVYLGSFTKAVRFASMKRQAAATEYGRRSTQEAMAILRVLVLVPDERIMTRQAPRQSPPFVLNKTSPESSATQWLNAKRAPFVDVRGAWMANKAVDAVVVKPTWLGVNPFTKKPAWIVKNEEWCVRPGRSLIRHVADLHENTVATDPWQPWRRSAAIL